MNRESWIDIMKGIGILAVVAGHIYGGVTNRIIFLFHIPLFFFLGGYLFRVRNNLRSYFRDKTIHLLMPYLVFILLIYVPTYFTEAISTKKEFVFFLIKPIVGGRSLITYSGVFWFVTCLFLVQQAFNFLLNKLSRQRLSLVMLLLLILGYLNSIFFPGFWLPWNANVLFGALPIFYIGYLFKTKNYRVSDWLLVILFALVIISEFMFENNTLDMKYADYGIPIITLISSIIAILFIRKVSELFSGLKVVSTFFIEIGKASMVIMYIHQPAQLLIYDYISSNQMIRFLLSSFISYLIYFCASKFSLSRMFFLGSKTDYKSIKLKYFTRPNTD